MHGDNETNASANNLGLLHQRIQEHGHRGRGRTSYLFSTICGKLNRLMGKQVLDEISGRIKESKYYSISLDSTADKVHVDQIYFIYKVN